MLKKMKKLKANIVDDLGAVYIIIFTFGVILLFAGYTKIIETTTQVSSLSMTYLNLVEQKGYLTDAEIKSYKDNLEILGVNKDSIVLNEADLSRQAPYGEIVELIIECDIKNPIWKMFASEEHPDSLLKLTGINHYLHYKPQPFTSTSKW